MLEQPAGSGWDVVVDGTDTFPTRYLLNDVVDVERDRAHPRKRHRPIASGRLPLRVAMVAGVAFLVGSVAGGLALDVRFGLVLLAYVGLTASYSFALKHLAIIDAMAVAMGASSSTTSTVRPVGAVGAACMVVRIRTPRPRPRLRCVEIL